MADTLFDPHHDPNHSTETPVPEAAYVPARVPVPAISTSTGGPIPPSTPVIPKRIATGWIVGVVVAVFFVLASGGALAAYFLFFRYEPTAERHVPANADVVVRVELSDVVLFEPFQKKLLPVLMDSKGSGGDKAFGKRLADYTGIDLKGGVRELVFSSVNGQGWMIAIGGRIPPGRFVSGIERLAQEEGWGSTSRNGELLVLSHGELVMGQANDGTVIWGINADSVRSALGANADADHLRLPKGSISFMVGPRALANPDAMFGQLDPSRALLSKMARFSGSFVLSKNPELDVQFEPFQGVSPEALSSSLEEMLGRLRLYTLPLPDLIGEQTALKQAKVSAQQGKVYLKAAWPYDGLERGFDHVRRLLP